MPFYAVNKGRTSGVFNTWEECKAQVAGFKNAIYKKFSTVEEANDFATNGWKAVKKEKPLLNAKPVLTKNIKHSSNKSSALTAHNSTDNGDFVVVYTDGASKSQTRAGLGNYWGENHPWNTAKRVEGFQTNNKAEIDACRVAIQKATDMKVKKLKIYTDSKFTINVITIWWKSWIKKNWTKANGEPVLNKHVIQNLVELVSNPDIEVKWEYVKAHAGIKGNEEADRLANEGCQMPLKYPGVKCDCDKCLKEYHASGKHVMCGKKRPFKELHSNEEETENSKKPRCK